MQCGILIFSSGSRESYISIWYYNYRGGDCSVISFSKNRKFVKENFLSTLSFTGTTSSSVSVPPLSPSFLVLAELSYARGGPPRRAEIYVPRHADPSPASLHEPLTPSGVVLFHHERGEVSRLRTVTKPSVRSYLWHDDEDPSNFYIIAFP